MLEYVATWINFGAFMNAAAKVSLLTILSLVSLAWAEGQRPESVEKLVDDLASDSYQVREKATVDLWEIGEEAMEPLREALASDDPEKSIRADAILEKIELRITPETAEEILGLIRRYREAPHNQKVNFLNELKRKKAFFQVLKLYSMETRPEVRTAMAPVIRGVAIAGAREAIVDNDLDTAVRLLEMSASEPSDMMALACLYRSMGLLEGQLANPEPPANVPTDLWRITLLRAAGDLEGAAQLAAASNQPALLAGLKVLTGDPLLWLQQNGLADRRKQAHPEYVQIALRRWNGGKVAEADFEPLLALLEERDNDDRDFAVSALASLGRKAEIEVSQAKVDPSASFEHYVSQEKIPEAMAVIGLDPKKPDYNAWVAARFAELGNDEDENEDSSSAQARLLLLASFLEHRGLEAEIAKAFEDPLKRYAAKNENRFLDFLGRLFEAVEAPRFASLAAAQWAGEDENRWSEVFTVALGEEQEVLEWLNLVSEIKPGLTHVQKLEVMLAIFKIGRDPGNLRSEWIGLAWKAVDTAPDKMKQAGITRIMKLAASQLDVENSLKAWDRLEQRNLSMWNSIDKYLSAAGRWKDAVGILEESGKIEVSSSPELHAYLATTLRRAGFEERASVHDGWAEKLALGYSPSCRRIADYYTYGGDPVRAAIWYQRAATQSDPLADDFAATLDSYAGAMMETGDWKIASSCYEALVQIYASRNFVQLPLPFFSKARLSADLAKALAVLPEDRERAIFLLDGIHENFVTDGVLADEFFPLIREAGLVAELGEWFGESWAAVSSVIDEFPESDNTRNTAAWFASRAGLKLEEARKHLEAALARNPNQAAYLDTMAEVCFASGDRKGAISWSDRAVMFYPMTDNPFDLTIRQQNHRFHHAELPK